MEAQIKVGRNLIIKVEAETQKDLFQQVASTYEVFGEKCCGLCHSEDILPAWRTVTKGKRVYDYPELHCQNPKCRARLSIGSNLDGGGLFPIRKLTPEGKPSRELGEYGPHQGWTKYRGDPKEETEESDDEVTPPPAPTRKPARR